MPELPEVETVRRGLLPVLVGQKIAGVTVRNRSLRQPIDADLPNILAEKKIANIQRRAKYLLFDFADGLLLVHLGMSGSLRLSKNEHDLRKHDHVIVQFANQRQLRYHDPRRFGLILWSTTKQSPLLNNLGVEPLTAGFSGDYLYAKATKRSCQIKNLIMDGKVVVGVGNIYANEALFAARINPLRAAKSLSPQECKKLVKSIKQILQIALKQGGTTLRDFKNCNDEVGHFAHQLQVYGRAAQACIKCRAFLLRVVSGQRSTFYCPQCQK